MEIDRRTALGLILGGAVGSLALESACSNPQGSVLPAPSRVPAVAIAKFDEKIKEGDRVEYNQKISGTAEPSLPVGQDIFVAVKGIRDPHIHPQTGIDQEKGGPAILDSSRRIWVLDGVTFGYLGNLYEDVWFEIFALRANQEGRDHLMRYLHQDGPAFGWPGILSFPVGVYIDDIKRVHRLPLP